MSSAIDLPSRASAATASADVIRAARLSRGWSLGRLGWLSRTDPAYLSRIERGLAEPSISTLYRLAVALGLDDLARQVEPFVRGSA